MSSDIFLQLAFFKLRLGHFGFLERGGRKVNNIFLKEHKTSNLLSGTRWWSAREVGYFSHSPPELPSKFITAPHKHAHTRIYLIFVSNIYYTGFPLNINIYCFHIESCTIFLLKANQLQFYSNPKRNKINLYFYTFMKNKVYNYISNISSIFFG